MEDARKKARFPFLEYARLARLMTGFLLLCGLLLPPLFSLGAQSAALPAVLLGTGLLVLFSVLGSFRHGRLYLLGLIAAASGIQFLLPGMGLFGAALQAVNAIRLYFSDVTGASAIFALQIGLTSAVLLAVLCYAFSSRLAGFLPATILTVLMLFLVCSLGQSNYLWLSAPALVAMLLLISQTANENGNLFEVLPLASLVVAAALGILALGQVVVQPLYSKAMELKQTIEDYLFFTDEREIFSIGQYGWYPLMEEESRMGGEVTPSDVPVLQVKTDSKLLLRGISKDNYNGAVWDNTVDMTRYLYVSRRWRTLRSQVFCEDLPILSVKQTSALLDVKAVAIQVQNTAASTLFTPVNLQNFSGTGSLVAYFNEREELFATRNLVRDDRYTVFAPVYEGGSAELGKVVRMAETPSRTQPADFYETYLQLPEHLSDQQNHDARKLTEDVRNIVQGSASAYDKACAIRRHLQRYCKYTLTPETGPANHDFVLTFLYETREGYSVHFASAMTVLCRVAGVPARYVEGFRAVPSSDGFAYVTGKNAAAWCEIWVDGFGWIPFDACPDEQEPTPPPQSPESPEPTPTPTPTPPQDQDSQSPTPTPDPGQSEPDSTPPPEDEPDPPDPTPQPDEEPKPNNQPPFPWWLLAVLALIAALAARIALTRPGAAAKRAKNAEDTVFIYGSAVTTLASLRKQAPGKAELPMNYARRLEQSGVMGVSVAPLFGMMSAATYGGMELNDAAVRDAAAIWRRCSKAQPLPVRIAFTVMTALRRNTYGSLTTKAVYEAPASQYDYESSVLRLSGKKAKAKNTRKNNGAADSRFARPAGETPPPMPVHTEEELAAMTAKPKPQAQPVPERRPQPAAVTNAPAEAQGARPVPEDLPSFGTEGSPEGIAMGGVSPAPSEPVFPADEGGNAPRRRRRSDRPQA